MRILTCLLAFASLSAAQSPTAKQSIEGLWRITYFDQKRGEVTGQAAIKDGQIRGFFFGPKGEQQSFVCKKFRFAGRQLEGTFSPYFNGTKIKLTLYGKDRLAGVWELRANIKSPGPREGNRTYENPEDPYVFTATGRSSWTRMTPKISRIRVVNLDNDALDFPKMKGRWDSAVVAANLPLIGIDLFGADLPTYYNSKFFDLLNSDDKLSFHKMEGFPKQGRIRMSFYILKGAKPGPKKMRLNGTDFVVPLVFREYDNGGKYVISGWDIDRKAKAQERRRIEAEIRDLRRRINLESSLFAIRNKIMEQKRRELLSLNSSAQELVKNVVSLISRQKDSSSSATIDRATERTLTRRSYIKGRIESLETQIISLAEDAEEASTNGNRVAASRILSRIKANQKELDIQKADLVKVEKSIEPYLKSRKASDESIREQIFELRGKYATLDRRRNDVSKALFNAQKKVEDQRFVLDSLAQDLNAALAAKEKADVSVAERIQSIRVANDDTNETLYYALRADDPKERLLLINDLIGQSAAALSQSKDNYLLWRSTFEDYAEEARYRQRVLGGATGKIMQSASIQAGSEALFFLIDLAEDLKDGGLPLVIGDLIYKTGQALNGDILTIDTLDSDQVAALRKSFSKGGLEVGTQLLGKDLSDFAKGQARAEAEDFGIKGPFIASFLKFVGSGDKNGAAVLRKEYAQKIADYHAKARRLNKKKAFTDFLEEKAAPKFINILKGAAKTAGNERLKSFAKSLEKQAYVDYFKADVVAKKSFVIFQFAREEYWRHLDFHNSLLRTRVAIEKKRKSFNRESGFLTETQKEFSSETSLRVFVSRINGLDANSGERVYLNGILMNAGSEHKHYLQATSLTPSNSGKVAITVRPSVK